MNWDGIIGSVANLVGSVLPLFFGALQKRNASVGAAAPVPIGPATLFYDAGEGTFQLGNFTDDPVMINFSSPEGEATKNLSVQLNFADHFDAEPWIQEFTTGEITVGTTPGTGALLKEGNPVSGIWTYITQVPLKVTEGVSNIIQTVVNPSLTLQFKIRFEANNQFVVMTAIGASAATILGVTYLLTARNNSGNNGSRSGSLNQLDSTRELGVDTREYEVDLPTGIDFSSGIYYFQIQLPVPLSASSQSSDSRVQFRTASAEKIKAIRAL